MSCGLKKLNTNEGGVHLTERTCSPYNPIIKLIVDDCLGLPIYPVTSIDAVIDEDGNTLRKLLEELLDKINGGSFDFSSLIEEIQNIVNNLDATYVNEDDLVNKLKLLYKISSMNRTDLEDSNLNFVPDTTKPYIVAVIEEIQTLILSILGNGTGVSLTSLLEAIDNLNDLLLAVANYNTETSQDLNFDNLSFSQGNTSHLVEIIYRIQNAISRLETIERLVGVGSGEDSLVERLHAVEEDIADLKRRVSNLEDASATHAHLDSFLLEQNVNKLAGIEYPITSAYFYGEDFEVGDLVDTISRNPRVAVYFPRNSVIGVISDDLSAFDYNQNNILDFGDLYRLTLYHLGHLEMADGSPTIPTGKNIDVNGDGDTTSSVGDVNALVDYILSDTFSEKVKTSNENSTYIYEFIDPSSNQIGGAQGNIEDISDLFTVAFPDRVVIRHPLIQGKVYVNLTTKTPYVYNKRNNFGEMISLGKSLDTESLDSFRSLTSTEENNKYTIVLGREQNLCYHSSGFTTNGQFEKDSGEPFTNGDLFIVEAPYTVVGVPKAQSLWESSNEAEYNLHLGDRHYVRVKNNQNQYEYFKFTQGLHPADLNPYDISDATSLINYLLYGDAAIVSGSRRPGINDLLEDLRDQEQSTTDVDKKELLLNLIVGIERELNGPTVNASGTGSSVQSFFDKYVYVLSPYTGDIDFIEVPSKYYRNKARNAALDFNGDNYCDISDATHLINGLLDSGTPATILRTVTLGAQMYKQTNRGQTQITPQNTPSVMGKIFLIQHEDGEYHTNDNWYYFDSQEYLRPLVPLYGLSFDQDGSLLTLHADSLAISSISLKTIKSSSSQENNNTSEDTYRVLNMGKEGTPYLFGVLDPDYYPAFERIIDANNNFLPGLRINLSSQEFFHIYGIGETGSMANPTQNMFDLSDLESFTIVSGLESRNIKYDLVESIKDILNKAIIEATTLTTENVSLESAVDIIADIFDTNGYLTEQYLALDFRYDTVPESYSFAEQCNVYTLERGIHLSVNRENLQNIIDEEANIWESIRDWLWVDGYLLIKSMNPVDTNTIYYFPKFGLSLRFEPVYVEKTAYYNPIIVSVEKKVPLQEHVLGSGNYIEDAFLSKCVQEGITPTVLICPGEYVNLGIISSLEIDPTVFMHIPGHESIEVRGRFTVGQGNFQLSIINTTDALNIIEQLSLINTTDALSLRSRLSLILLDSSWSPLLGHTYEYRILDGVLTIEDITRIYNDTPDGR